MSTPKGVDSSASPATHAPSMRRQLLQALGVFFGPFAVVTRPCMYVGGRLTAGPAQGEVQVGISPCGVIILLVAATLYACFRVLAEEGLAKPVLRAVFGNWR